MSKVADIESAVEKLSEHELDDFRRWFEEFDAARFDAKIERDAKSGKLNDFASAALEDLASGRVRSL
jgi:hypothetical protein